MAGTITTGSVARLLWPGVNTVFGQEYAQYKSEFSDIFTTFNSSMRFEEDTLLAPMGLAVVKNEGASIAYDTFSQGFTKRYTHVMYGKGVALTQEVEADIQYGIKLSSISAKELARDLNITKEQIAAGFLDNATSTSQPYVGGDGVALLSASHPLKTGGTFSNIASVDISEAALEDAVIAVMGFVDDAGKKIALLPKRMIIPKESVFIVERILKSNLRSGTADNDANALKNLGYLNDVRVNHYMADTDAWFILTNLPEDQGLKHFSAMAPVIEMDKDFNTKNILITAHERYSFGHSNPRCVYGSMGV